MPASGTTVQATVNGVTVPVDVVALADTFPTAAGSEPDHGPATLQAFLVSSGAEPLGVTQWWLATTARKCRRP